MPWRWPGTSSRLRSGTTLTTASPRRSPPCATTTGTGPRGKAIRAVRRTSPASPSAGTSSWRSPSTVGAITAAERAACWSRAWTALCAVGAEQESYAADADPVGIYLGSLRALIASGRVHVAGKDGGCPPENPVRWGWAEGIAAGEPLWRPQGELSRLDRRRRHLPGVEHRVQVRAAARRGRGAAARHLQEDGARAAQGAEAARQHRGEGPHHLPAQARRRTADRRAPHRQRVRRGSSMTRAAPSIAHAYALEPRTPRTPRKAAGQGR